MLKNNLAPVKTSVEEAAEDWHLAENKTTKRKEKRKMEKEEKGKRVSKSRPFGGAPKGGGGEEENAEALADR